MGRTCKLHAHRDRNRTQTLEVQGDSADLATRFSHANMADDKDPFRQLKDLTLLKGQLEDIRRRVEGEVQDGFPQGGSLLGSPFLKGFLAGYVVAKLRSSAILGVFVGTCTGIYAAQRYNVPNVEQTVKGYLNTFKKNK